MPILQPEAAPKTDLRTDRFEKPPSASSGRVRWDYMMFFVLVHAAALLVFVPAFFSWWAVGAFVVGVFLCGVLGINIGMHRLLSHRSFQARKWFERTLVFFALCSAQETPARWVAWHRKHHRHSDHPDDPHTPRVSFLWSHFDWLLHDQQSTLTTFSLYEQYARDVIADPFYRWVEKLPMPAGIFFMMHTVVCAILAIGFSILVNGPGSEAWSMAAGILVWGVALRTVYVWHITWSVNSLTHLIGYRNYETTDDSRNSWFVALITMGEGWHNNHHSDPSAASVQHKAWEIDPIYYLILLFQKVGLVTRVIPARPVRQRAKATA
ncbi:MAG: fatty acid desaturase [Planctomycetota bacterium]